jgi:hypothetical protein
MDKIEYEEWMLKGIHEGRGVSVLTEEEKKAGKSQEKIEVSRPLGRLCGPLRPKGHPGAMIKRGALRSLDHPTETRA